MSDKTVLHLIRHHYHLLTGEKAIPSVKRSGTVTIGECPIAQPVASIGEISCMAETEKKALDGLLELLVYRQNIEE